MKKKSVDFKSLLLMQGSALIYSVSNIFSKYASREGGLSLKFILFYGLSLFVMFVYAILWQQILKRVDMIVAYSNRLVAMIWGVVWGVLIFQEQLTLFNIIGTFIILIGLYLVVSDDEK